MTTEDKQTLGMDEMFAYGNEPLPTTVDSPLEPIRTEPEPAAPAGGPARDEHGRFASPQATPEAAPQAPATPPAATTDADPEKQPITKAEFKGMLEEREKRQAAQARADAAEARLRQYESQQQQPQIPSVHTDPEAYQQHIQHELTEARIYERTMFSEVLAKEKFGEDVVQKAEDWGIQQIATVPGFKDRQRAEPHPIDWLVKQYKRATVMNDVGDDPDAYVRRRAAELGLIGQAITQTEAQPSQAASPQPAPIPIAASPAPSRSIANATSAGGLQVVPPQGEFAALDMVHKH